MAEVDINDLLDGHTVLDLECLDRLYLNTILVNYGGGPVGIEALAATLNEEGDTLVDVVEPFLLKIGFVTRTPSGRRIGDSGRQHLGAALQGQGRLPLA